MSPVPAPCGKHEPRKAVRCTADCPFSRYNLNPQPAEDETVNSHEFPVSSRPSRSRRHTASTRNGSVDGDELPLPPVGDSAEGSTSAYRDRLPRRLSRQLRNAPVEERLAALRELRAQEQQESSREADVEDRHQRARITERLKETFRIRTRAQSSQERDP